MNNHHSDKNWLEWCVFAVGLVLVLGTIGVLLQQALTSPNRPPALVTRVGSVERQAGQYVLPVTVRNEGDQTAEAVLVRVTLKKGGKQEEGEFQLQFVPGQSERTGRVSFSTDPASADLLQASVAGYRIP